jgi:hypothetical protein
MGEGLDEIIVGTSVEHGDAIFDRVAGGEDQ